MLCASAMRLVCRRIRKNVSAMPTTVPEAVAEESKRIDD